jgi:hypothetical protein
MCKHEPTLACFAVMGSTSPQLEHKILFCEVVKTLAGIGFSQEILPWDLPLFHEIDPKDPMKGLD